MSLIEIIPNRVNQNDQPVRLDPFETVEFCYLKSGFVEKRTGLILQLPKR